MGVRAYSTATSVPQGGRLDLHLATDDGSGAGRLYLATTDHRLYRRDAVR
jgi:hypothetical protein